MKTYIGLQCNYLHTGSFDTVLFWARERVKLDSSPVKIFKARAGEKDARIVAEVTVDNESMINDGRLITLRELLRGRFK